MFLIIVISLIIYIVGAIAIYHNIYNMDKSKKIQLIVIGFILILLLTIVLVSISSNNITIQNKEQYIGATKKASILLFAPINSIIILPYIGNLLNRYTDKRINQDKLMKKILIFAVIIILILIFEVGYIKDFETGLIKSVIEAN